MISLIEFSSIEKANEAVALLDGTTLAGRQVHLRLDRTLEPKPEGVGVFVGNIPWDVSREDIVTFFASHRPKDCLIATNMVGKSRGFCILLFDDEATANQVIEKYHQADFNGRLLEVCHSKYSSLSRPILITILIL